MKKRVSLMLTGMMLATFAPFAMAQERDFGMLEMGAEAKEVGIGHLRLVRQGPEENSAEWVFHADVFDLEGHLSGAAELRYPTSDTIEIDFASADSGEVYRIRSNENDRSYSIEHVGVEKVTIRPLCDPTELTEKGKVGYTAEELEDLRQRQAECARQIEVTGTTKSWQEAVAQYEEVGKYLAAINVKVKGHLGLRSTRQQELQERLERVKREAQKKRELLERERQQESPGQESMGPTSGLPSLPQGLINCPPEEQAFCPFGNGNFAVLGEGGCVACSKSACCTEASLVADVDCQLNSLASCCANTLCQVTSPLPCWIGCNCQLIGYFWGCRPCD